MWQREEQKKMEKREKRALNRRLMVIYVGYFLLLAAAFVNSFLPLWQIGLRNGYSLGSAEARTYDQEQFYLVAVRPLPLNHIPDSTLQSNERMALHLTPFEAFATIQVNRANVSDSLVEQMDNHSLAIFGLNLVSLLFWGAIIVLIALIINSMRCSIRDQHPLPKRNILYMRLIGSFVILNVMIEWIVLHLGHKMVAIASEGMPETFARVIPDYTTAMLGLLIVFAAEIFAVGSQLSEEQEFTI